MSTVETASGPVDVEQLGLTLVHEHFRLVDEATSLQYPRLYDPDQEWDSAMADARAVVGHGVKTVVEPTAMLDRARRRVPAAGGAGERAQRGARHRRLHLRLPAERARQPQRGPARRPLRRGHRGGHPGHRRQGGVHQVRRRRAGHDARTSRSCTAPPRARACAPDGRSWPTRGRRAGRGWSRCGSSPRRGSTRPRSRSPTPATPTTSTTSSACSSSGPGSASTATASTSTCRPIAATPPRSRCSSAATPTA